MDDSGLLTRMAMDDSRVSSRSRWSYMSKYSFKRWIVQPVRNTSITPAFTRDVQDTPR